MKIGVYVGSFNPVHKGHIKVVHYLLEHHYLDKILMIPTLGYWHKTNLVDLDHRINMLKIYENDKVIVDSSKSNLEYTYQVMHAVKKDYPSDEIYLILGSDNLKKFHKWKNTKEILMNHVIVIPRSKGINSYDYINHFKEKERFHVIEDYEKIDISSTDIRNFIKEGNLELLETSLEEEVIKYIIENKLYL